MFGLTPYYRNELSRTNRSNYVDIFNLMDDFFNESLPTAKAVRNDTFKIDVKNEEDAYVVEAELPGFTKDEIKLDMNEDVLTISASKTEEETDEKDNYVHRERRATSVKRSLYLKDIDVDTIKASYENGILAVTLPKRSEEDKGRVIEID